MSIMPPSGNRPPIPMPAGPSGSSRPAVKPTAVSSPSLGGPQLGPRPNNAGGAGGSGSGGRGFGGGGGTPPPPPPNGSGSGRRNFNWQQLGQAYAQARQAYQQARANPKVQTAIRGAQKTARGISVAVEVTRAIPAPANTDFPDWGSGRVGFRGYDS